MARSTSSRPTCAAPATRWPCRRTCTTPASATSATSRASARALGGAIHGIEAGQRGQRDAAAMIRKRRVGLRGFRLVESSEQGMLAEVERAVRTKRPIVFLGWAPHPMNTRFPLRYLSGGDAWFGPDFGGATVHTLTRRDYADACPNVGRLLRNARLHGRRRERVDGRDPDRPAHASRRGAPPGSPRIASASTPGSPASCRSAVSAASGARRRPSARRANARPSRRSSRATSCPWATARHASWTTPSSTRAVPSTRVSRGIALVVRATHGAARRPARRRC